MAMRRMWPMIRRAVFQRRRGKAVESVPGGGHGRVDGREQAKAALPRRWRRVPAVGPAVAQDLFQRCGPDFVDLLRPPLR